MVVSVSRGEVVKAGALGFIGTFIDGYDLVVGVTAAALVFSRVFFPPSVDPALAAVYSLIMTTLVTFLFRPVGAFIFGHIGDKWGRKVGLVWDLVLVGIGTLIIGLAPDYATAGYLGLAMVLIGRILVGIGMGGEQGGAVSLVVEQAYAAGSRWRAFWGAVPYLAWAFVGLASSGILAWLSAIYPGQAFISFGWRVAFYIGATAAIVGVIVRFILLESIPFVEARRTVGVARLPAVEVFRYWRPILGTMFLYAIGNVAYYLYSSYGPAYAVGVGLPRDVALLAVTFASLITIPMIVLFTVLADMFGRRPIAAIASILMIPTAVAYPLMIMTKDFAMLVLALALMWGVSTGAQAISQAFSAEHFPTRYRYSGSGLGMQLGTVIGAGIATPIIAGLIGTAYIDRWWVIPAVMSIYSILSLLGALVLMRETVKEKLAH